MRPPAGHTANSSADSRREDTFSTPTGWFISLALLHGRRLGCSWSLCWSAERGARAVRKGGPVLLGRSDRGGARPRDVGGEGDEQQGEAQAHGEPAPEEARERRCLHCLVQEACKGFGWRCVPSEKNTRKEHEMGGRKGRADRKRVYSNDPRTSHRQHLGSSALRSNRSVDIGSKRKETRHHARPLCRRRCSHRLRRRLCPCAHMHADPPRKPRSERAHVDLRGEGARARACEWGAWMHAAGSPAACP